MKNIDFVPCNRQIIEAFLKQPPELTQKSFAVTENGETIAIVGILLNQNRWILFSHISPDIDLRKYKRYVLLAARKAIKMKTRLPLYAMADEKREGSDRLLKHLGFVHIERGMYLWQQPHHIS